MLARAAVQHKIVELDEIFEHLMAFADSNSLSSGRTGAPPRRAHQSSDLVQAEFRPKSLAVNFDCLMIRAA